MGLRCGSVDTLQSDVSGSQSGNLQQRGLSPFSVALGRQAESSFRVEICQRSLAFSSQQSINDIGANSSSLVTSSLAMREGFAWAHLPHENKSVVFGLFGVQALSSKASTCEEASRFSQQLRYMLQEHTATAADLVETYLDTSEDEVSTEIIQIAYWLDPSKYEELKKNPVWQELFMSADLEGDIGIWREVSIVPRGRVQHAGEAASVEGLAKLVSQSACPFSGWGAYRKRLPDNGHDAFTNPNPAKPLQLVRTDPRGRIVTVDIPQNVVLLREHQDTTRLDPEEKVDWEERIEPLFAHWLEALRREPEYGVISLRDVRSDGEVGRRSQLAYYWDLGHVERSARMDPGHLRLRKEFLKMVDEAADGVLRTGDLWVEVYILSPEGFEGLYCNVREGTGLLNYLPGVVIG